MPRALWTKAPLALLRHRVGLLAVCGAAFLVAVGAAAGPLMNAGAESETLQSKLRTLTPLGAGLVIDRPTGIDRGSLRLADERRRAAAAALARTLPSVGRPVIATTSFGQLSGVVAGAVRAGGRVTFVHPSFPAPPGPRRVTLPLAAIYQQLSPNTSATREPAGHERPVTEVRRWPAFVATGGI